jgi:hypothetical protein
MQVQRINTREELRELQRDLKLRPDWHEPDEKDITARYGHGQAFDNAGWWGDDAMRYLMRSHTLTEAVNTAEMSIIICHAGYPIAEINLATLFAFACGTYEG